MSRACGLSVSTVQRSWRAFGLQPHRLKTIKLSADPDLVRRCATRLASISLRPLRPSSGRRREIGSNPGPQRCCRCGQTARRSPDDARPATTSLFAPDIATGQVISKSFARHRATWFREFIDEIEAA